MNLDLPIYLFHQGTNFEAYDLLGSRLDEKDGKKGVTFRVWAPNADAVSVVGDFNGWKLKNAVPMERISDRGIFEVFIEGLKKYDTYKYAVKHGNKIVLKADPYAIHTETPSKTASKVYDLGGYQWKDAEYQANKVDLYDKPMNIYEVNLGSWKKKENDDYYTYRELARTLVPYVKNMGYTHVEIMPITEHPFDGSWGYQVTGYFAPTSRYGTPHDFMYLVDAFHKAGIGVILDWVPAHFPKDEHGLYEFDGTYCYENPRWDRIENKGWGTRCFDWGRTEVQSFLISSALFWLEKYHIDGLRVDAVASMLYLDYCKEDGEWEPNDEGGNYNPDAIAFFKKLNTAVFAKFPKAIMVAEESTSFPMITKPTDIGGLGFNFKWNMGWMNDVLDYVKRDPYFRGEVHNKLTFSLFYAFSENFVLPISHDEVVHGKKSLLDKMPGCYEDKFANDRAFLGYMMAHPGKKLNFMGYEFGQFKEWAYKEGIEFFMTKYDKHNRLMTFVRNLNKVYKENAPLFEIEDSWDGFEWISADESQNSVISFIRRDKSGKEIVALINFSGIHFERYRLGLPEGEYKIILNSDAIKYGGNGCIKKSTYKTNKKLGAHGRKNSIQIKLPRFTCLYLEKVK